jgi:hypothetical protein
MTNKEELSRYITELSQRKPVRKFKSDKGYDRVKDRKDKRLYEVDSEEEEIGTVETTQSVF